MMLRTILATLMSSLFAIGAAAAPVPPANELEKLFDAGKYEQFLALAPALVKRGDADALFLLGKAYHLGKGVEKNAEEARHLYERAAEKNHPRAIHNLGMVIMVDEGRPDEAVSYFERALALGLKTPTLHNLGRAHKGVCTRSNDVDSCLAAAGVFTQLWQADSQDTYSLDEAVVSYATGCLIGRTMARQYPAMEQTAESHALCKSATEWAEKGAALGLARASYNRAALDLDAGRYAEAIPWLKLSAERGEGLAAFSLGTMFKEGQGVQKNDAEELAWFKRGALLKNPLAIERMDQHWDLAIDAANDTASVKAAMAELLKIHAADSDYIPHRAIGRLKTMATLERNATTLPGLATQAINPRFCPDKSRRLYISNWWIVAMAPPGQARADPRGELASGRTDGGGCAKLTPANLASLRKPLALGHTLVLRWSGHGRLLSLVRAQDGKFTFEPELEGYTE